ncbi:MAG: hypothetical protein AAF367_18680 [Pseudomonadota bacterium]
MIPTVLISFGLVLVIAGLGGLVWCVRLARRAQSGNLSDEEIKGVAGTLAAVNSAAMGGAMLGLGLMLVGFIID